ncbi:uncharacterized protein LOC111241245 isoform X2 [Vigna radiata var. radiata]|uniref:Uncharacterized protein LOC111241245 isoform X2 n=1 Tax=Vigna radiata var. radiata TaxID=3916 RepID=A0A3Q0EQM4_VIGRR|nr:uncharacterized protein LOC111241245 isoform X2 [Vigna radiata var. radiata]
MPKSKWGENMNKVGVAKFCFEMDLSPKRRGCEMEAEGVRKKIVSFLKKNCQPRHPSPKLSRNLKGFEPPHPILHSNTSETPSLSPHLLAWGWGHLPRTRHAAAPLRQPPRPPGQPWRRRRYRFHPASHRATTFSLPLRLAQPSTEPTPPRDHVPPSSGRYRWLRSPLGILPASREPIMA